jgi:hypothetical protein
MRILPIVDVVVFAPLVAFGAKMAYIVLFWCSHVRSRGHNPMKSLTPTMARVVHYTKKTEVS